MTHSPPNEEWAVNCQQRFALTIRSCYYAGLLFLDCVVMAIPTSLSPEQIMAETSAWVNRAVIGLNLCPFARSVQVKKQIRYVVSEARDAESLLAELQQELWLLAEADLQEHETTLLIHPWVLQDFLDFNDFLAIADALVEDQELEGILQVASFHPDYQFAGTRKNDISNATNRAPYPTLHLLREDSLDRAVAAFPEPERIYEQNMQTMRQLGLGGWMELRQQCRQDAEQALAQPKDTTDES